MINCNHGPKECDANRLLSCVISEVSVSQQCYVGERGQQLQRQAAQRTMTSKPNPIVEVPYLLVNDYTPSLDGNAINNVCLPHLIQKWVNLRNVY
uniref:Uncharacterized protein n=1 Tax=Meloidogyne javanica TaxID=6303 RepID=A0A915M2F5_MELJA